MNAPSNTPAGIGASFVAELDAEMPPTRRVLERIPSDKGTWKPHEKSFPVGHLAQLVARMPGWLTRTMQSTELDIGGFQGYTYEKTETLLAEFDRHVAEAREVLSTAKDADFMVPWSLKSGGQVFFTLPRIAVMRQNVNHLVHHRAQLTVYLRLLDIPVPSIYGPTADEKW